MKTRSISERTKMKPTHRLKFLNKETEEKGELGAGWMNNDNSISIVLNPMVHIYADKQIVLRLFPINKPNNEQ